MAVNEKIIVIIREYGIFVVNSLYHVIATNINPTMETGITHFGLFLVYALAMHIKRL